MGGGNSGIATKIIPYEGLKRLELSILNWENRIATKIIPYEGLKQTVPDSASS